MLRCAILAIGLLACTENKQDTSESALDDSRSTTDSSVEQDTSTEPQEADDCWLPIPSNFVSVDEYEVGLGPDGPVMGHWTIAFQADGYSWSFSDVTSEGEYSCQGETVVTEGGSDDIVGVYDPQTNILMWDDVAYRLM